MTSLAFKLGARSGPHRDVHIYIGPAPGQRSHAGTLRVYSEELPDVIEALQTAGFDKVVETHALLLPPQEGR